MIIIPPNDHEKDNENTIKNTGFRVDCSFVH